MIKSNDKRNNRKQETKNKEVGNETPRGIAEPGPTPKVTTTATTTEATTAKGRERNDNSSSKKRKKQLTDM